MNAHWTQACFSSCFKCEFTGCDWSMRSVLMQWCTPLIVSSQKENETRQKCGDWSGLSDSFPWQVDKTVWNVAEKGKRSDHELKKRKSGEHTDERQVGRSPLNKPEWQNLLLILVPFPNLLTIPPTNTRLLATWTLCLTAKKDTNKKMKAKCKKYSEKSGHWLIFTSVQRSWMQCLNSVLWTTIETLHKCSNTRVKAPLSAHTHKNHNYRSKGNWLPLSGTFHSGQSQPDAPGLWPTTAYALGKHHHLSHTQSHTHSHSAIQEAAPVTHTGGVINGVWVLDMTALLSLCDKESHKVPFGCLCVLTIACVHPLSTDLRLLLLKNATLA